MIKFTGFPVIKAMTFITIGNSFHFKLADMNIFVAIRAIRRQTRKPLGDLSFIVFIEMTGSASLVQVRPRKGKLRYIVIKLNFLPHRCCMAISAIRLRVILFIKIRIMDIIMTIITLKADLPETPFFSFFMTGKAGRSHMCALQGEDAFVMLFKGVGKG